MLQFLNNWGDLIVATSALVVAIISLIKTNKQANIQTKLNEHELNKLEKEIEDADKTFVEVNVVKVSSRNFHLKVSNLSKNNVYNVNVYIDSKFEIAIFHDNVIPFEMLEPYQNFELFLITHSLSKMKFEVNVEWDDDKKAHHKRTLIRTLT